MKKFISFVLAALLFSTPSFAGVFKVDSLDVAQPNPTIDYMSPLTGAVARTYESKFSDMVSVADFMTSAQYADGQTGTPTLSVASAFSLAASAAPAYTQFHGNPGNTIASAPTARVFVPNGRWTLGSLVNTGNRNIVWVFDAGASVTDPSNLNGSSVLADQLSSSDTSGLYNSAASYSIIANSDPSVGAQVNGIISPSQLGAFPSRDSVALYTSNTGVPATITIPSATYTATTIVPATPLTADQIKLLRVGMLIDTQNTPTKYSGVITGWDAAGGTYITVSGWYLSPGPGTSATPSAAGAYVNPITKIFGGNTGVYLPADGLAQESAGWEFDTYNDIADPINYQNEPVAWGVDSESIGPYKGNSAFIAHGKWFFGFNANGQDYGFRYTGTGTGLSYGGTGPAIQVFDGVNPTSNQEYALVPNAAGIGTEYGNLSVTSTPYIDWHSSGANNDYDVRMIVSGGGSTPGGGNLTISAATIAVTGSIATGGNRVLSQLDIQGGQAAVAISVGASPFQYTATYGGSVAISGGAVSQVTLERGGTLVYTSTLADNDIPVRAGDIVTVTYSTAPAMYQLSD